MANHVNAYKGVKKIYHAEIVSILAAICMVVVAILELISPTETIILVIGGFAIATVAMYVIAFILQMLGLEQAGKDHSSFKTAFWIVVLGIVLGIAAGVMQALDDKAYALVGEMMTSVTSLINILVIMFIITGISSLVTDEKFASKGKKICLTMAVVYAITFTISILTTVCENAGDTVKIVFGILALLAALVDLIIYINIFFYYKKALTLL